MMEAVRSVGLAARFVSGYLYDERLIGAGSGLVGLGATHAWLQVYLPGAGWVEFDPTNALVGGRNLIRVAVARDASQAAPLVGSFTGLPDDPLGMEVEVAGHDGVTGTTATRTASSCRPPPMITPRSGETSPKSRPQAIATWSVPTRQRLVGSSSIQPKGGAYTATQACEASWPTRVAARAPPPAGPSCARAVVQVAADVARREAARAQAGDHQVREVLADAASAAQHLGGRRRDAGRAGRIGDVVVQPSHQRVGAFEQRALRRERLGRVVEELLLDAHVRRLVPVAARLEALARGPAPVEGEAGATALPGVRVGGAQRGARMHVDLHLADHRQLHDAAS